MTRSPSSTMRRRRQVPFFVGFMLLYGRHSSVQWKDAWSCYIDAPRFAKTLGTNTTHLRAALEWLRKNRYLSELSWGHGWVQATIVPPIDRRRYLDEEET